MNENPIWRKETLLFNRGLFLPLLISFTNLILLILFISNLYYISLNGLQTGEIRYSAFLQIYYFVAVGLFLLLLLLAPAITVSGLSMEEEQNMLELLLGTDLDSKSIIFGKLFSEISTLGTLAISSLPFLATVYIYSGIPNLYLFLYFLTYGISCLFLSALGIAYSLLARNIAYASIFAYGFSFLLYGLFFYGIYSLQKTNYMIHGILFFLLFLLLLTFLCIVVSKKTMESRFQARNPLFTREEK